MECGTFENKIKTQMSKNTFIKDITYTSKRKLK